MKFLRAGEGIQGESIAYEFGMVPATASLKDCLYQGHMVNSGVAVVQVALFSTLELPRKIEPLSVSGDPLDSIQCQESRFACREEPDLPGERFKKSGAHTGWRGEIRGGAMFKITKPLAAWRNA